MNKKLNITKAELLRALQFCNDNKTNLIVLHIIDNPIGEILKVSLDHNSKTNDITNYEDF